MLQYQSSIFREPTIATLRYTQFKPVTLKAFQPEEGNHRNGGLQMLLPALRAQLGHAHVLQM
jgi:hypothetical protein